MAQRSGTTAYPGIGVWYDAEQGDIHLSIEGQGLSTVHANPKSKRGNPFVQETCALASDEGKPHPSIDDV